MFLLQSNEAQQARCDKIYAVFETFPN